MGCFYLLTSEKGFSSHGKVYRRPRWGCVHARVCMCVRGCDGEGGRRRGEVTGAQTKTREAVGLLAVYLRKRKIVYIWNGTQGGNALRLNLFPPEKN